MQNLRLLTIDDEEPVRRNIRVYFEDSGFRVYEAEDGETGLRLFRKKQPVLVLVDLRMPGMSGLEVIVTLAKEAPDIPLVVLSGTGDIADAIDAIRKGAWDYVMKPIAEMAELEHVAKNALERARLRKKNRRYHRQLEDEVKRRTQALRESEKKYRDLVENLNDAIFMTDAKGRISYASPPVEVISGRRPEELIGRNYREFLLKKSVHQFEAEFKGIMEGRTADHEYCIIKKSGEPVWVRFASRPVCTNGRVTGIQGILTDITMRKLAEHQLERKIFELGVLNSLAREIGTYLSVEVVVKTAVKHARRSLSADMVMIFIRRDNRFLLKGIEPESRFLSNQFTSDCHIGNCLCGMSIREGKALYSRNIHVDSRFVRQECKEAGVRSFTALPLLSAGKVIGILGVASFAERDFNARASFLEALSNEIAIGLKNAMLYEKAQEDAVELQARLAKIQTTEKEKDRLTVQLQQAQKMEAIGTLAGGIAHDFNNILGSILGYSELIADKVENTGSDIETYIENVLKAVNRAKDLVAQILHFSRQADISFQPVVIKALIKEIIKLLRATLPSTITIELSIELDTETILADPSQIHQVVMNLCSNAFHAMREKGGILSVTLTKVVLKAGLLCRSVKIPPGNYVVLSIKDTGHGIDVQTLDRIFDPYFTTKEKGEGTGLGLSVSRSIVQSHGGFIQVESCPGRGSDFSIYLQLSSLTQECRAENYENIEGGNESVLFVDDESFYVDLAGKTLRKLGYRVAAYTNSVEALEVFKANPKHYDLVITDQTMPNMTGLEMSQKIRELRPDLPIIICTGFSEFIKNQAPENIGVSQILFKPTTRRDLALAIRKVLADG